MLGPLVGAVGGAAGTTCTLAPAVFATDGGEYPMALRDSTVATIRSPSTRAKVSAAVSAVIGIVQVRPESMAALWASAPSQAVLSTLKRLSLPLICTLYCTIAEAPSKVGASHSRTTLSPEFEVRTGAAASGTVAMRMAWTGEYPALHPWTFLARYRK